MQLNQQQNYESFIVHIVTSVKYKKLVDDRMSPVEMIDYLLLYSSLACFSLQQKPQKN